MNTPRNQPTQAPPARPTHRSYLSLVTDLGLADSAEGKNKGRAAKSHRALSPSSAANDARIPETSRNTTLASLAGTMRRRGMTPDAIEAALQAENRARCTPPLDPKEVSQIATSIGRYPAASTDDILKTLTDTGNATRFGRRHVDDVMYVFGMGWFIWDGLHWQRDDRDGIIEMAKQVARDIYAEGEPLDDSARKEVTRHTRISQQAPRLKAMLELAQSLPELAARTADLDAHDMLLGVANGVLDLKTGMLQPASRTNLLTRHAPVIFDANARCPRFLKFIDEITAGNRSMAAYLQRVIGYALTGDTSEQCLFFLYGSGANGKSVLLNVIKDLLGQDLACQTPSETLMTRRSSQTNDIARLHSVRAVMANEVEDGTLLAESLVKQLTGGDSITARFHYKEFFEFVPKCKLFIAGNHKPVILGRDNGIWRRIRLLPFEVTIPAPARDKNLQEKLSAEMPGILNWAIQGCRAWQRRGLAEPKPVQTAVETYKAEMDTIGQWIAERCTVSSAAEWQSSNAYFSYRTWAQDSGYRPMASGTFSRDMEQRFSKVKRKDANYFIGIKGR